MIRFLATLALTFVTASTALAAAPAPGAPGDRHTWTAADKHGFGTATQLGSRTWFTLRSAELTEVYYPDLGTPSLRQLEFVVTDGKRFVDRETGPGVSSRVEPVPGSLTFRQVTETRRWRITKTWIGDPARDAVLGKVRFRSLTGRRLRLYVLVDPAPGDDGNDDRGARVGRGVAAWDDTVASVVAADPGLGRQSSGYAGTDSDPWHDLRRDGDLDRSYEARQPGNVVQAARTRLTGTRRSDGMTLAIGFGSNATAASLMARAALEARFGRAARAYAAGWAAYLGSVNEPPSSVRHSTFLRRVYDQSVMVLEASEDKIYRGASIASPTMPWVWGTLTLSGTENSGPYHLVWPRDLYHVATAQQALGDEAAATRLLDYLWRVQKPDGSWWQNTEVSGEPHWTGTQMDEVSLPIVLAWWLGRTSAADWQHVRAAADYVVANGPRTPQERWENQDGWSPNTIATEIAGLICAADIARRDRDRQQRVLLARPLLRARHEGRQPERRLRLQPRRQLPASGGRARDRRPELPRARPVRRQAARRPDRAELAEGRRRRAEGGHPERADLVPLHPRRLRRDGERRRLGHLPHRRAPDVRAPVAAPHRRARRVRAACRPQRDPAPGHDRADGERRPDAPRAGVGRPPAHGTARPRVRRGHALGHAARLDARAAYPAGLVDRGGRAGRAPLDRGLPLHRRRLRVAGPGHAELLEQVEPPPAARGGGRNGVEEPVEGDLPHHGDGRRLEEVGHLRPGDRGAHHHAAVLVHHEPSRAARAVAAVEARPGVPLGRDVGRADVQPRLLGRREGVAHGRDLRVREDHARRA